MDLLGADVGSQIAKVLLEASALVSMGTSVGKVMDNADPDKMMRCKVFVYGLHPKEMMSDVGELPWVMPMSTGDFSGASCVPANGTLVNIHFEGNDINYPRYTTKAFNLQTIPDNIRKEGYPNLISLFNAGGFHGELNRLNGELSVTLANSMKIIVSKDGSITIDNHLSVSGNGMVSLVTPTSAEALAQEINAEVQNKIANGAPIRIRSSGKVILEAPEIELGGGTSQVGSIVTPDPNPLGGGGFNCLTFCPFSGVPHQGRKLKSFYSSAANTLEQGLE